MGSLTQQDGIIAQAITVFLIHLQLLPYTVNVKLEPYKLDIW